MPLASLFERYTILSSMLNVCMLPAAGMLKIWAGLRLPPHGDAGFVMIIVFMVAEWIIAGFLVGVGRAWYLQRKVQLPSITASDPKRKFKRVIFASLVVVLVVGGYCIKQEVAIKKDREFFLHQVDYKEFAEACLDLIANPDKYALSVGRCRVDDPKLPEAIRRLQPTHLDYHGYSIRIDKAAYYQGLLFTHSFTNATQYDVLFESNYAQPIHLYTLHSGKLPKFDWQ